MCMYVFSHARCQVYISKSSKVRVCPYVMNQESSMSAKTDADEHSENVIVVVEQDPTTKKSNSKKNKERATRARAAKNTQSDDQNYDDICRQLANMQKTLTVMKQSVGFSRATNLKKAIPARASLDQQDSVPVLNVPAEP